MIDVCIHVISYYPEIMKAFLSLFFILSCFISQGQYKAPEVDSLLNWFNQYVPDSEVAQGLMSDESYAQFNAEQQVLLNEIFVSFWEELAELINSESTSENTLKVYPNPTSNQIQLDGDWQDIRRIAAIDEQGKRINLNMNQLEAGVLSLEELQAGMYILTFYFETHTMVKRIVKR